MNRRRFFRTPVGASIAVTTAARLSLDPITPPPLLPKANITHEILRKIYDHMLKHKASNYDDGPAFYFVCSEEASRRLTLPP